MDATNTIDNITQNNQLLTSSRKTARLLNSDSEFRDWFVGMLSDPDGVEETVVHLLHNLTAPLKPQAGDVLTAVAGLFERSADPALRNAAAAALARMEPERAEQDPQIVEALVQTLKDGDEEDVTDAVEGFRNTSATVRRQRDVVNVLKDTVNNLALPVAARCVALSALICNHDIKDVVELVRSAARQEYAGSLRREALAILEAWDMAPYEEAVAAPAWQEYLLALFRKPLPAMAGVGQLAGASNPTFREIEAEGAIAQIAWKIRKAASGERALYLYGADEEIAGSVVLAHLTSINGGPDLRPIFVALRPTARGKSVGKVQIVSAASEPDVLIVANPSDISCEMAECIRLSYKSAQRYDAESLPVWRSWLANLPVDVRSMVERIEADGRA